MSILSFLQLSIVILGVLVFGSSNSDDVPCICLRDSFCSLIPPKSASLVFPCYQGLLKDAAKCYETDPLLKDNTTWACGNCTKYGFPDYKNNDPIYTNMELWFAK